MKKERFKGELLGGHKESAIEVPFDPAERWSIPPNRLRPGRWGHPVKGSLNGTKFEGVVVPRSRKFWLLVDEDLHLAARLTIGDLVDVTILPRNRQ